MIEAPQLTKEGHELYKGRIMDMRPGYAGKDLTTGEKSRGKYVGVQLEKRKATSRPVLASAPPSRGGEITARDTEEYIFDESIDPIQSEIQKKEVAKGWVRNPNFGQPTRVEPLTIEHMKGVVRHPKTRKPLRKLVKGDKKDPKDKDDKTYKKYKSGRFATGDIIEEHKTFTTSGKPDAQKPVEEYWGLAQKGMNPDAPADLPEGSVWEGKTRDPWAGRRTIGGAPKKRATKKGFHGIKAGTETAGMGEADVKAKLARKKALEKDPNYRPSDMRGAKGGFNYGSGVDNWARKDFDEYQSTPATELRDEVENEDIDDATLSQLKSYAPQDTYRGLHGVHKTPKFPSRPDRPRSITNPPMNDLQATNPDPNFPADPSQMRWAPTTLARHSNNPLEWHEIADDPMDM